MIVSQDDEAIEIRSRHETDDWTSRVFHAGEQAGIPALGCSLDVAIVYRVGRVPSLVTASAQAGRNGNEA